MCQKKKKKKNVLNLNFVKPKIYLSFCFSYTFFRKLHQQVFYDVTYYVIKDGDSQ